MKYQPSWGYKNVCLVPTELLPLSFADPISLPLNGEKVLLLLGCFGGCVCEYMQVCV